ncbi:MAG: transposase [Chloroflexi bacterium]|nr:transposase [Chloroflexota bacterium]
MLGIDLGLETFATIAYPDGTIEKVRALEPLKPSLRALRRSHRKLARRKEDSNNRARARRDLGRRHRWLANIRKDFLHQVSHRITASAEVIQVEDVSLKGWQRMWAKKR